MVYSNMYELATLFLELWKRHRSLHVSRWNVFDWCEDEVEYYLI